MHPGSRPRRFRATVTALLALGLAAHLGGLGAQEATGALIASGESPDLFLLYTGDVSGYIDPCG